MNFNNEIDKYKIVYFCILYKVLYFCFWNFTFYALILDFHI